MKWLLMSIFLLTSCNSHKLPRDYRKMHRRLERNERRQNKDEFIRSLENDTIRLNWIEFVDSTLIGFPKLISGDSLKDKK
jgi:hypothetical protein